MSEGMVPGRLYKYQPFTTQTLANLTNRQIWFSKPARFNDPFDCGLKVWNASLGSEDLRYLFQQYRARNTEPEEWDARYLSEGAPNERFREDIERGIEGGFTDRHAAIRERGVACFSETCKDLLMWAHYADGHRGFCLEFDTSFDQFPNAQAVKYSSEVPSVDAMELLKNPALSNVLDAMVLTKSDRWRYEKEWRLLHMEGDHQYTYDWKALTGIYLGAAMPEAHQEMICLILCGSPTRFFQMSQVENRFSLSYAQFKYDRFRYGN